jgi:hypothetical protein
MCNGRRTLKAKGLKAQGIVGTSLFDWFRQRGPTAWSHANFFGPLLF